MIIAKLKQESTIDRFSLNPVYEVIDYGVDTSNGYKVELPHCDPRTIGGVFDERICEWIIPKDWRKYIAYRK